jgi:IS30 family transposase
MNKNYNKLIDEFLKKNTTFQKYKFNKKAKDSLNAFIRRTLKNELMKSKPKAKPRK